MLDWFASVFSTESFMPHGHCYLWLPGLVALHVGSDALIGAAYLWISGVLVWLVRRIQLPFSAIFIWFGLFIGACGLTHLMAVWTLWEPDYWLSGGVKLITAAASVATAVLLVPVLPRVVEMVRSARVSEHRRIELESANRELQGLYTALRDVDDAKTRFFGNVSHELRAPLALILGPLEAHAESPALAPELRRDLDIARSNARILRRQVDDLLDVARFEAGGIRLQVTDFDLAGTIRSISRNFDAYARERRIRFEVDADEAVSVQADRRQIEKVLINLLTNAFKFTPPQGEVRVSVARENGAVAFAVDDSGPGVPGDQREAIFERFSREESEYGTRFGGTGLGLSIAKDVVEQHGGKIEVGESAAGGARFRVSIPLNTPISRMAPGPGAGTSGVTLGGALEELRHATAEAGSRVPAPAPVLAKDAPVVLLVEDNRDMASFVAALLQGEGYRVVTASSGREGLKQAHSLQPDLILSDVMMPGLPGDRMFAELRRSEALSSTPVVFLTAKADEALAVDLLKAGAADFIRKPFESEELTVRVSNLIRLTGARNTLERELSLRSADVSELARELVQRKRDLQAALNAAEVARNQAERASAVKSDFLSLVSHELKTPLTTVGMHLQVIKRTLEASGDGIPADSIDSAYRAFERLGKLVESMLEYVRIESRRVTLDVEPVDLCGIVDAVREAHAPEAEKKGLSFEADHRATRAVHSDPQMIRQVLDDLVSNALRFTSEGAVRIETEDTSDGVLLRVSDSGVGIAREDLGRIFEPFEQVEAIRHKSRPGVGLGLALVQRMVESLYGKISVSSEPGKGSVFTVNLPDLGAK